MTKPVNHRASAESSSSYAASPSSALRATLSTMRRAISSAKEVSSPAIPLLDGVLGESIVNHRTFPIAMATSLDLLKLNSAVAHVMNDEGARLFPARQFTPMERESISSHREHDRIAVSWPGRQCGPLR